MAKLLADPNNLILYTDGSQISPQPGSQSAGDGAVAYWSGAVLLDAEYPLGCRTEVYDAELCGMHRGLYDTIHRLLLHIKFKNIHIFADNSAAIWTIFEGRPGLGQTTSRSFRRTAFKFLDADATRQIHVGWVPGHCGIEGNDRADVRAKAAAEAAHPNATR